MTGLRYPLWEPFQAVFDYTSDFTVKDRGITPAIPAPDFLDVFDAILAVNNGINK
jgi:hypothetical protein